MTCHPVGLRDEYSPRLIHKAQLLLHSGRVEAKVVRHFHLRAPKLEANINALLH
jgi:hypothetical protein